MDKDKLSLALSDISFRDSLFKPYFNRYCDDKSKISYFQISVLVMEVCDELNLKFPSEWQLAGKRQKDSIKRRDDEYLDYSDFLKEMEIYLSCMVKK